MKDIKILCQERGLKMKDVAEHVGVSPQNLGVSWRNSLKVDTVRKVTKVLGMRVRDIFEDEQARHADGRASLVDFNPSPPAGTPKRTVGAVLSQ